MQKIELNGETYLLIKESDYLKENGNLKKTAHSALNALSCTELDFAKALFKKLDKDVTDIIISEIAKKANVTGGIASMMLRKLQGHSIIECSSMGQKGTRIKLLNKDFKNIIAKI